MRFWDSSAIVPLLVEEAATTATLRALEADTAVIVWWGTTVECISALARREREGVVPDDMSTAIARLDRLAEAWEEIQPSEAVRRTAIRLLRTHPLRAGDAMQLAAARIASEEHPETLAFVTFDDRLMAAAQREGFAAVRPAT